MLATVRECCCYVLKDGSLGERDLKGEKESEVKESAGVSFCGGEITMGTNCRLHVS
jgi:hypothetical protein